VEKLRSLAGRVYITLAFGFEREEGQAMVEYALLLSLIAVVSIGILTAMGTNVSKILSKINHAI